MQLSSRQRWSALSVGLAVVLGVFGFMFANYYFFYRSRLCPAGLSECDPYNFQELAEGWFDAVSGTILIGIPLAALAALLTILVLSLASFLKRKIAQ